MRIPLYKTPTWTMQGRFWMVTLCTFLFPASPLMSAPFIRGDADASGRVDLTDALVILNALFQGREAARCDDAVDVNDDGRLDVSDSLFILLWLSAGGLDIAEPGPEVCGPDPTADELDCEVFAACTVPDVLGLDELAARARIADAGFFAVSTEAHDETIADGYVISQDPAAATLAGGDAPVSIVVSIGPVTDNDTDAVDDILENRAPNGGDGNGDGLPDSEQDNVASLPNTVDGRYVSLATPPDARLARVAAVVNPSSRDAPAGLESPIGFFTFRIQGLTPGGSTTLTFFMPADVLVTSYHKYGPTPEDPNPHWYDFAFDGMTGAEIAGDSVILHFVDGQRGDDDLVANGEVSDPGAPTVVVPVEAACGERHELARGEFFSCELPTLVDETGSEIESSDPWTVTHGRQVAATLPPGLSLLERAGRWFVEGVVAPNAPLESRTVNLRRLYPGLRELFQRISFVTDVPVRVWTQNTLLRPNYFFLSNTGADNRQRMNLVINRLNDYDIVALQEVFDPDQRGQLEDNVGAYYRPFYIRHGPAGNIVEFELENAGLALVIRQSFQSREEDHHTEEFDECDGYEFPFDLPSADCLAAKGFSLTRIYVSDSETHPDDYVYVVNLHTQAGPSDGGDAVEVRASQFRQLRDAINALTNPTHPVLIMGDLNVPEESRPFTSEYNELLGNLTIYSFDQSLTWEDDLLRRFGSGGLSRRLTSDTGRNAYAWAWFGDDPRERLDYILLRQGTAYRIDVESIRMTDDEIMTRLCSEEGWLTDPDAPAGLECYLSDHYGVEANLSFSKQRPEIRSPEDGSSHLEGADVAFRALYTPRWETFRPVDWSSNQAGDLGTQSDWGGVVRRSDLPVGTHIITASVNDPLLGVTVSEPIIITIQADTDRDGLGDEDEDRLGTDPNDPDTDRDGVNDGTEVSLGTNPLIADTDLDGLPDGEEVTRSTDPTAPDTDSDGVWDAVEVVLGKDPTSDASTPDEIPQGTLFAATARGHLSIIDIATRRIANVGQPSFGFGFGLSFARRTDEVYVSQTTDLVLAHTLTAGTTTIGALRDPSGEEIDVINLAFHPTNGLLYGIEEGPAPDFLPTEQVVTIDPATGVVRRLNAASESPLHAIAFDGKGRLYGAVEDAGFDDRLVTIDPATGAVLQDIGPIGFSPVFGLASDGSGVLYGAATEASSFRTRLVAIDTTTGQGTTVAEFDRTVFDLAFAPCASPCLQPAPGSPLAVGGGWDLAIEDLNADGDLDVVTSAGSVLLGAGNATFSQGPPFTAGSSPVAVLVADLNADGRLDVATTNSLSDDVSVLTGNGDGTFKTAQSYPVGERPVDVAVGDVDGDGTPDLVTANGLARSLRKPASADISVLLGVGNGAFQAQQGVDAGDAPRSLALADMNADQTLDIIAVHNLYRVTPGPNYLSDVVVLRGVGNGTFQEPEALTVGGPEGAPRVVAVADLNGDGLPDLVTGNAAGITIPSDGSVGVLLGVGGGRFGPAEFYPGADSPFGGIAVADMNGDGIPDVLAANNGGLATSGGLSVFLGKGDGTLEVERAFRAVNRPSTVAVGDLDGDGDLDAVTTRIGEVSVLVNE